MTRVVGRIPDIPGVGDLDYLEKMLASFTEHAPLPAEKYRDCFALTAERWVRSTEKSVIASSLDVHDVVAAPPVKPPYSTAQLLPRSHFINLHGVFGFPGFIGESVDGRTRPHALNDSDLNTRLSKSTIVAAECCFGAQMFRSGSKQSMAASYLANGAIAYLGSSNTSYGSSDEPAHADLMCQYFFNRLMQGASAGRALLESRLQYIGDRLTQTDPVMLKTVAQFFLLGDPAIQPVAAPSVRSEERSSRRLLLSAVGRAVSAMTLAPEETDKSAFARTNHTPISEILKREKFTRSTERVYQYDLDKVPDVNKALFRTESGHTIRFRVYTKDRKTADAGATIGSILVIKEQDNVILESAVYEAK